MSDPVASPSFAVVAGALLAGGESCRFGQDKASFILPGSSLPLWRRQWSTLASLRLQVCFLGLRPGQELTGFSPEEPLPSPDLVVRDDPPGVGPLGSLAPLLEAAAERGATHLVVLAVDMPRVAAADLEKLIEPVHDAADPGLVPRRDGRWEPLLAVYPTALGPLVREQLDAGRLSLQDLVDRALEAGLVRAREIPAGDSEDLFFNINRPGDVESFGPADGTARGCQEP